MPATFRDAAGSSLIAYATYRLASLSPTMKNYRHLDGAEAIYQAVQSTLTPIATFTDGAEIVNALTFTSPAQMSPESLAFFSLVKLCKKRSSTRKYYWNKWFQFWLSRKFISFAGLKLDYLLVTRSFCFVFAYTID